tara:strand:+ start:8494 stop:10350 length:1857 start_codon:yes stop_codon:yes gene_type:complete
MIARKAIIRTCLYFLLLAFPFTANAINLGQFTLNSYLGQPFKAEIDIVSIDKEDTSALSVKLAPLESFQELNIDYASFLTKVEISIEKRSNGQPYIRLISQQPVTKPFFILLIEFRWSSGLLLKKVTVLLDLPEDISNPNLPVVQPDSGMSAAELKKIEDIKQHEASYIPVVRGDNLTKIARKIDYHNIQLNQLLVALYRANNKAFFDNNMNRLRTGPMLRVPNINEVTAISPEEADIEVKIQAKNWELYRQKLAEEVYASDPAAGLSAQISTGKISTKIDKSVKATIKEPEEKLSISNGEGVIKGGNGKNVESDSKEEYIAALEDNAIAKEKELNEANESIAILEENIKKLQQLLELRNSGISEIEAPIENASKVATETKLSHTIAQDSGVDSTRSIQESSRLSRPIEEKLDAKDTMNDGSVALDSKEDQNLLLIKKEDFPSRIGAIINNLIENIVYIGLVLFLLLMAIFAIKGKNKKTVDNDSVPKINESRTEKDKINLENNAIADTLVSDNTKDIGTSSFPDGTQTEEITITPVLAEEDLPDINLNIDNSVSSEISDSELAKKSDKWHKIATKIDLARAYQEMGDKERAKEVIQEILNDGDDNQRKSAKNILENL